MTLPSRIKRAGRMMVTADLIALLLFSAIAGIFTLLAEVAVAGMSMKQWFWIRVLYNILRFGGARLLGRLTDLIRKRLLGRSHSRLLKAVADTSALWLYHFPIYLVSATLVGATLGQVIAVSAMYLADTILTGWLYGVILDLVRARFKARAEKL